MAKTKQKPKVNELFEETLKTVSVAKNIEDEADKTISYNEQLRMLENHKQSAKSREEYEAYEDEVDTVKKDIKFNSRYLKLTDEQKEMFTTNYQIERLEAKTLYKEMAQEASEILEEAMTKVIPILQNMQAINNKSYNAHFIQYVLSESIHASPTVDRKDRPLKALQKFPSSSAGYDGRVKTIEKNLNSLNKSLKKEVY